MAILSLVFKTWLDGKPVH